MVNISSACVSAAELSPKMTGPSPLAFRSSLIRPSMKVITDPDCLDYLQNRQQWANLNAVVKVTAQRETATGTTVHSRYYISSLARPAQTLLEVTRRHRGIENSLHWSLDVTFREDHSRVRKDNGPQTLAVLGKIALNLLKQETSLKRGLQGKRLKAGWVEDYLLKVLLG